MSQHVSNACNESNGVWLPIIEYSVKTGVSLSTIRRKIKSNSIQYRLDKGRYLILYNGMNEQVASLQTANTTSPGGNPGIPSDIHRWQDQPLSQLNVRFRESDGDVNSETVDKAVSMISDAYEHAVTEKEARIRQLEKANKQLEERVAELRLLIRVLEEKFNVRY